MEQMFLEKSILAIYGKEVLKGLISIEFDDDPLFVTGIDKFSELRARKKSYKIIDLKWSICGK